MPSRSSKANSRTDAESPVPVPIPVRATGPLAQLDYVDVPVLSDEVRRLYNVAPRRSQKTSLHKAAAGALTSTSNPMPTVPSSSDSEGFVLLNIKPSDSTTPAKASSSNGMPVRQTLLLDHFDDDDDDESMPEASELISNRKSPSIRSVPAASPVKDAARVPQLDKGKSKEPSRSKEKSPGKTFSPPVQKIQAQKRKKVKGAPGLFRNFDADSGSDDEAEANGSAAPVDKANGKVVEEGLVPVDKGKGKAVEEGPATDKKRKGKPASVDSDEDDAPRPRTQPRRPSPEKTKARPAFQKSKSQPNPKASPSKLKSKDSSQSRREDRKKEKKRSKTRLKGKSKDVEEDLRSNLNMDAFVRSTKDRELARRKKGLEAFKKRRQKREMLSDSDADSDISSDSSSLISTTSEEESISDSSKADSLDFIVENDDEVSFHQGRDRQLGKSEGAPARAAERAAAVQRRLNERDAIREVDMGMPFRRLSVDELCHDYVTWLVYKILDLVEANDPHLLSARSQLQRKQQDVITSLGSMAMRRQFYWVLRHYPHCDTRLMKHDERIRHVGCAACKRSKQVCETVFTFHGRFYEPRTLEWRDSDSSSAMSTDASDLAKREGKGRDQRLSFYVGRFCASRARHLHSLHHWEYNALSAVNRLPSLKAAKRGHRADALLPEHIEAVVTAYAKALADLIKSQASQARDFIMR